MTCELARARGAWIPLIVTYEFLWTDSCLLFGVPEARKTRGRVPGPMPRRTASRVL